MTRHQVSASQQRGQSLYSKGDFKGAVEAFGEALRQPNVDTIGILDNRCATYCKLEQYDLARRDAKQMIKTAKDDERGYMRCGKVLLLEGKLEKAQEVYAYGLKRLPSEHPRRGMLEQLHKKLEDRMLSARRDPFTLLPLEVAVLVIKQFSFKQIVGILRVCKDWERLFGSMTNLWMHIDLTGARGKVPWTAIRSYIRRSKAMLTHATIRNLSPASTPKTLEFLSRCPRLEHLEVWVSHDYKDFYQKFKGSKKLKNLVLSADMPVTHEYLGRLLTDLPKLERIALWNIRSSNSDLYGPSQWPKCLPNLKSITLASRQIPSQATMHDLPVLSLPGLLSRESPLCPNLEELRLDYDPDVHQIYNFPFGLDRHLPPLRRLEIRGKTIQEDFCAILPNTIEHLHVQGGSSRGPAYLHVREETLPNLHTLIFIDTGFVTPRTLPVFLNNAQAPLRTLYLNECFHIKVYELIDIIQSAEVPNPALEKMTELSVTHMRGVDDAGARRIFTALLELKVLNLSYTLITGVTVRLFADALASDSHNGAKLDRLVIRGCEGVSSDAIAYGREKGLEVIT
ncbi:F-box/TPR repeat protein pof3 [Penicillium rolfsii]|nr:F-box/TPR repeat protein pof3 [Penicillium rolfsii]